MSLEEITHALRAVDLIHSEGDDQRADVAPPISVTTTFRYPSDSTASYADADPFDPPRHVYSRYTQDVRTHAEKILSKVNNGFAIMYTSGIASAYAALVHYSPKYVAISGGYHGCHATIEVYKKTKGPEFKVIDIDAPYPEGTLCWLETPLNPTGESRNIKQYADKVHAAKGHLIVDSTFGPPPLQYPFKWGADCILHSATKYFGGHSDLLCGVLVVKTKEEWKELFSARTYLGSASGSLESWLLLRSLRTLHLRVPRQSETSTSLAQWLYKISQTSPEDEWDGVKGGLIVKVWHSSLQAKQEDWVALQMEGGWNPTFSILVANKDYAGKIPHLLNYFVAATSLGGVESLVEQRVQSDPSSDPCLLRLSIGVEDLEDLKEDFRQALKKLTQGSQQN